MSLIDHISVSVQTNIASYLVKRSFVVTHTKRRQNHNPVKGKVKLNYFSRKSNCIKDKHELGKILTMFKLSQKTFVAETSPYRNRQKILKLGKSKSNNILKPRGNCVIFINKKWP
ncbi:hypothetical protein BT93_B1736 [Corymbia citriodora subsp. variegata]|nr:hypothetical protein BT93_B1736 [Corymbia citriodora subsp. variegata]